MKRTQKITYWITTIWLALGMTSTGIVQIIGAQKEVEEINRLGYPSYLLMILGVWKLLGVIAVLVPRFPLLKEWAYAGFLFMMSGAVLSHLIKKDGIAETAPALLLLILTLLSWWFRPAERRIFTNQAAEIREIEKRVL
jgi:hypothetical protein